MTHDLSFCWYRKSIWLLIAIFLVFSATTAQAQVQDLNQDLTYENILQVLEDDPERGLKLITQFRQLAQEQGNAKLIAQSHFLEGEAHYYLSDLEKALESYFHSRSILEQKQSSAVDDIARTYAAEAFIYLNEYQLYSDAIKTLQKGLPYAQLAGDRTALSDVYSSLGSCYMMSDQLDSSAIHFTYAYETDLAIGDSARISSDLSNLGRLHVHWGNQNRGLDYYRRSLQYQDTSKRVRQHSILLNNMGMAYQERGELDSAEIYLKQAYGKSLLIADSVQIAHRMNNLALLALKRKEYTLAEEFFQKSIAIYRRRGLHHWFSRGMANLAGLHGDQGRNVQALQELQLAREVAEEHDLLNNLSIIYPGLIKNHRALGQHTQALTIYDQYALLKDSLFDLESREHLQAFDAKYRATEKQAELEQLRMTSEASVQQLKSQRRAMLLSLLALALVTALIIGYLRFRQRLRQQKQEQTIALQMQQIDHLRSEVATMLHEKKATSGTPLDLDALNQFAASPLTEREFEILQGISQGLSNREISEAQFVSINTVKFHLKNIYDKLDVRNRVEAVRKLANP